MNNLLCKYKDIFGVAGDPKRPRIYGIPIRDVIVTLFLVWAISYFGKVSFLLTLCISLIAMVIFHRIFCVRTTTDKWLFPDK